MNTNYRYQLENRTLTGRPQRKTTCPQCGRRMCFVRYVDTQNQNQYLSDEVGRCDHEQSCGFHYKPSEYFSDHPWLTGGTTRQHVQRQPFVKPTPPPLMPLPADLVRQYQSPHSNFWQWFSVDCAKRLGFKADVLRQVYEDYQIGATQCLDVVFWQMDEQQRVRTGHIMQYSANGHRKGLQTWIHSYLIRIGQLPGNFVLQQCLFGQHLLPRYPKRHVCIVESEKTALVMAAHQPQHLWLATCGCNGLKADKLECLRDRSITLFPDSGCLEKWQEVMRQTQGLMYNIDDGLEQYPPNTDLADILLAED